MAVHRRMLNEGYMPNATTYNALISAYGKAGQLDKVMEVRTPIHLEQSHLTEDEFDVLRTRMLTYMCTHVHTLGIIWVLVVSLDFDTVELLSSSMLSQGTLL